MDYLKYFKNGKYQKFKNDCWTLLQDIYKDEHGIILPDIPIFEDEESFVRSNIKHKIVDKPKKGVRLVCFSVKLQCFGVVYKTKRLLKRTVFKFNKHFESSSEIPRV